MEAIKQSYKKTEDQKLIIYNGRRKEGRFWTTHILHRSRRFVCCYDLDRGCSCFNNNFPQPSQIIVLTPHTAQSESWSCNLLGSCEKVRLIWVCEEEMNRPKTTSHLCVFVPIHWSVNSINERLRLVTGENWRRN